MRKSKSCSQVTGLIVAFDIGTTYSRVSYRFLGHGQFPEATDVVRFGVARSDTKVPSLLYYDNSGTVKAVGDEVLAKDIKTAVDEGWTKAEWWKLHLRPKHYLRLDDDLPSLPPGKSAVDVLTDFIEYLFRHTKTYIQESHPTFTWSSMGHSIEYILTYPSGLGVQQDLYRRAIDGAGLVPSTLEGRSRVHMLTEGEASFHFCVTNLLNVKTIGHSAHQGIVIIDAGGGTVDLSMFSATSGQTPCQEIAPAECRLQGSVFVTRRVDILLQGKLKGLECSGAEDIIQLARKFDQTTKLAIKSDQEPAYVKVGGLRMNSPEHNISFGELRLSGEEATGLFNDSVNAIIDAFEQQRKMASVPITTAFFLGDFANNDWLWSQIQSYFENIQIRVFRPTKHIGETVVHGAVLSYLNHYLAVPKATCITPDQQRVRPMTEVKVGNTVESLSVQEADNKTEKTVEELDAKFSNAAHEKDALHQTIQSLHAILHAHEQKHKCETLYSQDRIKEATESLLEIMNTPSEAVRTDKLIVDWLPEFTRQCISALEGIGDKESSYEKYDEAIAAYSSALALSHSTLNTVTLLSKWTNVMLIGRSVDEVLIASAKFKFPRSTIFRVICDVLEGCGRIMEAIACFRQTRNEIARDTSSDDESAQWELDFQQHCLEKLGNFAEAALDSQKYDEAANYFSTILSLDPVDRVDILIKRSKARALMNLWEEALRDIDEVIELDHEKKRITGSRENYTALREAIKAIDDAIHDIFHVCPLVLIDLTSGRLCDTYERVHVFKSEIPFKRLVLETVIIKLHYQRVHHAVAEYFKWVMLSHTWEGREPTFQDVSLVDSVWSLDQSPQNEKLRQFCTTARGDGYRWAWSDTCCIDKSTSAILSQSLTSMYRWYEEAAATLVHLADVLSSAGPGGLTKSWWMTRSWTLQELLASKVIRFYTREWKLYLNDMHRNHKESPLIMQELAEAMGVASETISSFRPEDLGVREKLRLASKRHATKEEDIAYSLIGVFSSSIRPQYGLGKTALGELLENTVDRTGDVTVIAWTGKSLPYNSALPDSLAVYSQTPHTRLHMEADELDGCVERLRTGSVKRENVLPFYYQIIRLPRATFSNRRLQLPCICCYVTKIGVQELGGSRGNLYHAIVPPLGRVGFRTVDAMPLQTPRKLVLVHPWLRELCDPLDSFASDDEAMVEVNGGWVRDGEEAESHADPLVGSNGDSDVALPATPLLAEPSVQVDPYIQALRLVARLERPFNALLLEWQNNGQYKRVATEREIVVSGIPYQANPSAIRVKVLEIV